MPSNSSSSPDTSFTPRREFIREQKQTNSFSLFAIAGSSCIRLYSFPLSVITHLRTFFDKNSLISGYREDVGNNFCEFALDGKPWSSPKSVATERLLLELLAILYLHGYSYVSTIDYGREPDDRLVITFSKPAGRSETPPSLDRSKSSFSDKPTPKRAPFALSFPSSTLLRVVCPPLDSTPAILQAVRGSWPRGVISEKKVGDSTFEFKLKGYRWFQQDTFAVDSLRHILSLLSSLDAHSFTLLSSISLTSRSRVKDLWLFTGPASSEEIAFPDSPAPSVNASQTDFKRPVYSPDLPPYNPSSQSSHRRLATDPSPAIPHSPSPFHPRSASDDTPPVAPVRHASPRMSPSPVPSNTLRKPAPRAQVPVSVAIDGGDITEGHPYRAQLPSTIPSDVENMTGVGTAQQTPDVFYQTSPFHTNPGRAENIGASGSPPHSHPQSSKSSINDKPGENVIPPTDDITVVDRTPQEDRTPPLLSPNVFRDSTMSSSTEMSTDIPIKWTGIHTSLLDAPVPEEPDPDFPGGWQPTPIEEEPLNQDAPAEQAGIEEQPIHDVSERIASPALSEPDASRKSEVGMIGVLADTDKPKEKEGNNGQGWVLVNVEAPKEAAEQPSPENEENNKEDMEIPLSPDFPPLEPEASMSPAAKAIVVIDAVDAKKKSKGEITSQSRVRKFFSISRKDSKSSDGEMSIKDKAKAKSRSNIDKLKNIGTPEASRAAKRRSIDG